MKIDPQKYAALAMSLANEVTVEASDAVNAKYPDTNGRQYLAMPYARAELNALVIEKQREAVDLVADEVRAICNLPDKMNETEADLCMVVVGVAAATVKGVKLRKPSEKP